MGRTESPGGTRQKTDPWPPSLAAAALAPTVRRRRAQPKSAKLKGAAAKRKGCYSAGIFTRCQIWRITFLPLIHPVGHLRLCPIYEGLLHDLCNMLRLRDPA